MHRCRGGQPRGAVMGRPRFVWLLAGGAAARHRGDGRGLGRRCVGAVLVTDRVRGQLTRSRSQRLARDLLDPTDGGRPDQPAERRVRHAVCRSGRPLLGRAGGLPGRCRPARTRAPARARRSRAAQAPSSRPSAQARRHPAVRLACRRAGAPRDRQLRPLAGPAWPRRSQPPPWYWPAAHAAPSRRNRSPTWSASSLTAGWSPSTLVISCTRPSPTRSSDSSSASWTGNPLTARRESGNGEPIRRSVRQSLSGRGVHPPLRRVQGMSGGCSGMQ